MPSDITETQTYLLERLSFLLREHRRSGARSRRMRIKALPMTTEARFEHIDLRRVMSPTTPSEGLASEAVFDSFLYPLVEGEGDPEQELRDRGGDAIAKYVLAAKRIEEQIVRLLFCCSNAQGATCIYDDKSFMVTHDEVVFGFANGKIVSRFCSGLEFNINPAEILGQSEEMVVTDRGFCALYREAYYKGRGAADALIALYLALPKPAFDKLLTASDPDRFPTQQKMHKWEEILTHEDDPLALLYLKWTPRWMTRRQYNQTFGCLSQRPINPKPQTRIKLVNAMHHFFYKNKREK